MTVVADQNFTVSDSISTVQNVSATRWVKYGRSTHREVILTEDNIDEGHWTTVVDFTVLDGGGVDLDELLEHL